MTTLATLKTPTFEVRIVKTEDSAFPFEVQIKKIGKRFVVDNAFPNKIAALREAAALFALTAQEEARG